MIRYIKLALTFFRYSWMADLEYRMNIVTRILVDLLWYTAQLSVFEVLFSHTSSVGGWTLETTRVFMGVLFFADSIYMILFSEGLDHISWMVRRGELDLLLTKPVNSQFMVSLRRMNTAYLGNTIFTLVYLAWALSALPGPFPWERLPLLLLMIPCGIAIVYSFRFAFGVLALIFQNAENLNYVWYQIYRLGTRPDSIYPTWLRYVVLSLLPVGFVASVPARLLIEPLEWRYLVAAPLLAFFLLWCTKRFWRYALKHYTSASS